MADIKKFIDTIEAGNNMHSVIMMKGDDVLFESYWAPYTAKTRQRMYSQTKSLVGIAIGIMKERPYAFAGDAGDGRVSAGPSGKDGISGSHD